MIPPHLHSQLKMLEARKEGKLSGRRRIAVFDLDNTLLVGDIGEAVFARLLRDGARLACGWKEYESFLRCDQSAAYRLVVETMAGLSPAEVERATIKVLSQPEPFIEVEGTGVPVPRVNRTMREFAAEVQERGYEVYVISASNQTSVRIVCEDFFGISPKRCFGLELSVAGGRFTNVLKTPYPIGAGKVELYRAIAGDLLPQITATDSFIDAPLLSLTDPLGLSVWVGKSRMEFKAVRDRLRLPQHLCFVQRPMDQNLRKRVRILGEQWSRVDDSPSAITET